MSDLLLSPIRLSELELLIQNSLRKVLSETPCAQQNINLSADRIGGIELAEEITGLARPTIYSLVHSREIPHIKKSARGKLYFSSKELTDWLKEGRRKTISEIQNAPILSTNKKVA